MPSLAQTFSIACTGGQLPVGPTVSTPSRVNGGKLNVRAQSHEPRLQPDEPSRRRFVLRSVNVAVLAEAALNQSDPRTVVNSLLGMISVNRTLLRKQATARNPPWMSRCIRVATIERHPRFSNF